MHSVAPSSSPKLPAAHALHADAPTVSLYFPPAQERHCDCPSEGVYLPVGHEVHDVALSPPRYVPAGHGLQAPVFSSMYKPSGQPAHSSPAISIVDAAGSSATQYTSSFVWSVS